MRRWKRLLAGLGILTAVAIGLIIWDSRSGRVPALAISFVGYTNSPFVSSTNRIMALLRVTNTGPVTLRLLGVGTFTHSTSAPGSSAMETVDGGLASPVLKAGASATVEVEVARDFELMAGNAAFVRWRLRDQVCEWGWSTGNATIQRQLSRIMFTHRDVFKIDFGPITNQPPMETPLNR